MKVGLEDTDGTGPLAVVIFGVTGDLTRRKLMPALFSLFLNERIVEFKIIGFARRDWSAARFQSEAAQMISIVPGATDDQRRRFLDSLDYIQSSFEDEGGYGRIPAATKGFANRIYYLSTPPQAYSAVIRGLGDRGLSNEENGYTRIVVEKPFGRDLESAVALNHLLDQYFSEQQIYRIDHYLGKETVQNLMMLRFGNTIFEPVWNNRYIDHVQITVAESVGVGTRGNYYERAGALRDMIQNHTFQLLAITAMEPPNDTSPDSIRGEKLKVIKALSPATHLNLDANVIRAQYGPGVVDGMDVPGYLQEEGVNPESRTETYVALRLHVDSWRWSGVPFVLRSGKRLSRKVTEISVHFKQPPLQIFGVSGPQIGNNVLVVRIQPHEGITLTVNAKVPGYATAARGVNMEFAYGSSFGRAVPEAYERLLFDAIKGDNTLYTRRDEIETSWSFVSRILDGWANPSTALDTYPAGTAGPDSARRLLGETSADVARRWRRI